MDTLEKSRVKEKASKAKGMIPKRDPHSTHYSPNQVHNPPPLTKLVSLCPKVHHFIWMDGHRHYSLGPCPLRDTRQPPLPFFLSSLPKPRDPKNGWLVNNNHQPTLQQICNQPKGEHNSMVVSRNWLKGSIGRTTFLNQSPTGFNQQLGSKKCWVFLYWYWLP